MIYRLRTALGPHVSGPNELGLRPGAPAGAFAAFADARAVGDDSREVANMLPVRARVACLPGVIFGPERERHLRFALSTALETIGRGLDAPRAALR